MKETGRRGGKKKKPQVKEVLLQVLVVLHVIVFSMAHSAHRTDEFRKLADRLIPRDNATRWNSWENMVTVAVEKQEAVDTYQVKFRTELKGHTLSADDWKKLKAVSEFLQNFKEATLRTEGKHGYIGDHLIILTGLHDIVAEEKVNKLSFLFIFLYLLHTILYLLHTKDKYHDDQDMQS